MQAEPKVPQYGSSAESVCCLLDYVALTCVLTQRQGSSAEFVKRQCVILVTDTSNIFYSTNFQCSRDIYWSRAKMKDLI